MNMIDQALVKYETIIHRLEESSIEVLDLAIDNEDHHNDKVLYLELSGGILVVVDLEDNCMMKTVDKRILYWPKDNTVSFDGPHNLYHALMMPNEERHRNFEYRVIGPNKTIIHSCTSVIKFEESLDLMKRMLT